MIPVLLPGADPADPNTLPRFLSRMVWVDFRGGLDDSTALDRLLAGIRGHAPGPGLSPTSALNSQGTAAPSVSRGIITTSQRRPLQGELDRLEAQYDTLTRRLSALDTDIGRALGSLEKQVLEERRADLEAERQKIAVLMNEIEKQLSA